MIISLFNSSCRAALQQIDADTKRHCPGLSYSSTNNERHSLANRPFKMEHSSIENGRLDMENDNLSKIEETPSNNSEETKVC